ncbi:NAD(P)H-quinone oxidoreductase subunit T, chloroplastic-like [Vicia villosa]|uniref:NAD(P)H-quinone oxidoreductase subunit T, chloroplastic-like n=1 Tax=Vicia villosa TaxID=3911 RepID=UPI00273C7DD7|nr:NAD(P)H-quinone oxidoreductase subunit T, chloroplastic-like [Vicia villosa]
MASPATPSPQILLFNPIFGNTKTIKGVRFFRTTTTTKSYTILQVHASKDDSQRPKKAPPGTDTRIHWENEDEGWIGGSTKQQQTNADVKPKKLLGEDFADLLNFQGSHYEFLGISPDSDLEEVKVAFRKLSKEYHPDTTSLPLKTASEKFMKLREVYNVLSDEESRRFYDWTLAQEVASRQEEKLKINFEDPYEVALRNYKPVPDMVDRLGGKNMKLSDQAVSAITIDVFIIIFSICCLTYVVFFKEY